MKRAFGVSRDVTKLFKRDAKTQDCCFVDTTAIRDLFERQTRITWLKAVQHTQCAFNRFYTTCCVQCLGFVGHRKTFRRNYVTVYSQFARNWKSQLMKAFRNE